MKSLPEVIAAVQLLQKAETGRTKITLELKQEISDIGTLMHRLAAEPRSTAGLLFSSRFLSGTILIANPVFDVEELAAFKSRANAFLFS